MAVVKFVTLAVGVVVVLLAAPCALAASAFRVVWNAPSQICENCGREKKNVHLIIGVRGLPSGVFF